MTKQLIMIVIAILSLDTSTLAQTNRPSKQPSIWIGMSLQLGMSRSSVITQLSENYSVTKMQGSGGDEWIIAEKNSPETWIGHLGFRDGKLTYASRSWTQGNEDKYTFAQALWGAFSQMDSEGQRSCAFEVPTTRSPVAELRYVRLYCGGKRIEITMTNIFSGAGQGQSVQVDEILSSEASR
jgi:hypothetical protein